jgi:ubiquinone/menaquinone biosynthesis C-methylase UbiE
VASTTTEPAKESVREFWEASPCGAKLAASEPGTPEFFAEVERTRYAAEPFIERFARFSETSGQDVLEIGSGLGTDLVQFARAGARVTGVDLTEASVQLVRRRLALEGLDGTLRRADAETLPFEDGQFDVVYSWGVLHHTPDTEASVREAIRVTRPGGRLCVMLYGRHSWVGYGLWVRWALLTGHPGRSLSDVIADHMESAGTKAYTRRELRRMFAPLEDLRVTGVSTPYDRRVAGPLVRLTGSALGWFLVVEGRRADR